jgi:hypothetical protein
VIFQNVDAFKTWHEHLGHLGIEIMRKIMSNSSGHGMSDKISRILRFYVHLMCNWEIDFETFTSQNIGRTTKVS